MSDSFIDMLLWYGEVALTNGHSVLWSNCFSSSRSYESAVYRLRKAGVIAGKPDVGKGRMLYVEDSRGEQYRRFERPDKFWKKKWKGYWNVLVYDIPEKESILRRELRKFMRNLHMGCLQRSVWVTPNDIRPDYNDLVQTINIQFESYLFEATTVLGRSQQDIVLNAWDFTQLGMKQGWYLRICRHNVGVLKSEKLTRVEYENLAREEISAYHVAMTHDPLLPQDLLPHGYLGPKVYSMHKKFVKILKMNLINAS